MQIRQMKELETCLRVHCLEHDFPLGNFDPLCFVADVAG